MPITNTERVLSVLPYTTNTYGSGPDSRGNAVGNSKPIELDNFKPTPDSGFQANLYKDPVSGKYTVAIAGSNDLVDWTSPNPTLASANLMTNISQGSWDPQFTDAIRFTAEAFKLIQREAIFRGDIPPSFDEMRSMVQVVGHSLGGANAELVSQFFRTSDANIDGPGGQAGRIQV